MTIKGRLANAARRTPLKKFFPQHLPENRCVFLCNKFREVSRDGNFQTDNFCDNTVITSKYTLWNFVPKNLFEQFRRIANFYFLCVSIILLLVDSPVSPATNILPLVFVVVVTAVKQGYEDWLRHRDDRAVNEHPTLVVRDSEVVTVKSKDIIVGDIVKVNCDGVFPCDMVLLASSEADRHCSVQTTNLDGETNLKVLQCPTVTGQLQTVDQLDGLRLLVECEQPTPSLYDFVGNVRLFEGSEEVVAPLDSSNVLLRGAKLKNTSFVYGCAIYTGRDTKMALNSEHKSAKRSRVERKMNVFLLILLTVLLAESAVCTALTYWWIDTYWIDTSMQLQKSPRWIPWYIPLRGDIDVHTSALSMIESFLAFIVLFNYIIPISLYVTVEFQKFLGSLFFGWDLAMYDEQSGHAAKVNTSDLNEELGQVNHLFCDKTGTLTENQMEFRCCCVGTDLYEDADGQLRPATRPGARLTASGTAVPTDAVDTAGAGAMPKPVQPNVDEFLSTLAICHTARVEPKKSVLDATDSSGERATGLQPAAYVYQAASPDEKALLEACQSYGVVYCGTAALGAGSDSRSVVSLSVHGKVQDFTLLHTLEFDSERKCMSVLVKDGDGLVWLLCKGAESTVLRHCTSGPVDTVLAAVDEHATLGYRTLVVARRRISSDAAASYLKMLTEARESLADRTKKLKAVYCEMEQDLEVLGATAVEDRLQDGVIDAIRTLREAGIKVWVLTGDKEETAVNVGYMAGLFSSGMQLVRVVKQQTPQQALAALSEAHRRVTTGSMTGSAFGIVLDGDTIAQALASCDGSAALAKLCGNTASVLCCRMSPLQKAEVVKLINSGPDRPVTAAIGDGANDVGMLQEAHVGIGIIGKEGRHAARCSDYAFARFRFIQPALLVHGYWYYTRLCNLVQYSFYKNVAFVTAQVYYSYFNAFSAQTIYDDYYLTFFNITFTSLPILIYGLFEQHRKRDILEKDPTLYRTLKNNVLLSSANFTRWILIGLWHSAVVFAFPFLQVFYPHSTDLSISEFGTVVISICMLTVNIQLMFGSCYLCASTAFGFALTFAGYFIMGFFYTDIIWPSAIVSNRDMYWVMNRVFGTPSFYFLVALCVAVALIPDVMLRCYDDATRTLATHQPLLPAVVAAGYRSLKPLSIEAAGSSSDAMVTKLQDAEAASHKPLPC